MNLCNITWAFLVGLIYSNVVDCMQQCCAKNVLIHDGRCTDGKMPLPNCDSFRVFVDHDSHYKMDFWKRNDSLLGEILDLVDTVYIVKSPNFCVGKHFDVQYNINNTAAIFCMSGLIKHRSGSNSDDESADSDNFDSIVRTCWIIFDSIVNILSILLLAIAFYVYYLVIQTRRIDDICLLNVVGSLCLADAARLYAFLENTGPFPDLCISKLYMMNFCDLVCFAWYSLFMYYVWRQCRPGVSLEHDQWIKQLRIVGYGVPITLIMLANIHVHFRSLKSSGTFETYCFVHEFWLLEMYVYFPTILAIGLNGFFWSVSRKLAQATAVRTNPDELSQRTISSLLTLNQWLFLALALPWLLGSMMEMLINFGYNKIFETAWLFSDSVANTSGIFVPLVLVMSRARVWKCVTLKYENWKWLEKWKPSDEESYSVADKDNLSKTLPSEV